MGIFSDRGRYEDSESSGSGSYFDWQKAGIEKSMHVDVPKKGKMQLDIVPYYVATDNHPLVYRKKMNIGDPDYVLDIWVHKKIGPGEVDIVCPKKNYGKPCPICDYSQERYKEYGKEDEDYKNTRPKRRVMYNVLDAKNDSDLLVFEVSHYLYEKEVIDEAKAEGETRGESYLDFADPKEGMTVECRTVTEPFGGNEVTKFKNFKFLDREAGIITKALMKEAIAFDKFLILYTEDQINEFLHGQSGEDLGDDEPVLRTRRGATDDDDDESEAPKRRKRSTKSDDDDNAPKRKKSTRKKIIEEEEEEEEVLDDDLEDDDDVEEEEEEEEESIDDDDDLEDDDDEEEEDEEEEEEEEGIDDDDDLEDDDEEEEEEEEEEDAPPPRRKKATASKPASTKSKLSTTSARKSSPKKRVAAGVDTGPDDDELEEAPKRTKAKASTKKTTAKAPVKKTTAKKSTTASKGKKCPHGHKFGVDTDEYETDCDNCDVWRQCTLAKKKAEK